MILSTNLEERKQQIVDAALNVYSDNLVMARLCAAQAFLEAGLLNTPSTLASKYNNLFGIKGQGTKGSVSLLTSEVIKGKWVKVKADFAVYENLADSCAQHRVFLGKPRYRDVWEQKSLREAAIAVHRAGYATDPNYAQKLIDLYEKHLAPLFLVTVREKEAPLTWWEWLFGRNKSRTGYTGILFKKPQRFVNKVYIHCTDASNPNVDVAMIDKWHKERGWSGIGYHYFIQTNGTLEKGRDIEKTPAAQQGHNEGSIAICLNGAKLSDFNEVQFKVLRDWCKEVNDAYNGKVTFHGHCEVSSKTCPIFDYKTLLKLSEEGNLGI